MKFEMYLFNIYMFNYCMLNTNDDEEVLCKIMEPIDRNPLFKFEDMK